MSRPSTPRGARTLRGDGRELEAVGPQPLPVDLEQLHVDHYLGRGLVDGGDEPGGRRHPLGRVPDRQRSGGGDHRQPAQVEDEAEHVDGLLQVRVAHVEGLDDLLLVVGPLPGGVRNHGDGTRPGDAVEVPGGPGDGGEGGGEPGAAQIDGGPPLDEVGIEDDVDVREQPQRGEDVARARVAEDQRVGQDLVGQLQPLGGEEPGAFDQRLGRGLPGAQGGAPGRHELCRLAQGILDVAVGGVQLGRDLVLDQGVLVVAEAGEAEPFRLVVPGGAKPGALERPLERPVVRTLFEGPRVLDHRLVEVLRQLRRAGPVPGGRRAAGGGDQAEAHHDQPRGGGPRPASGAEDTAERSGFPPDTPCRGATPAGGGRRVSRSRVPAGRRASVWTASGTCRRRWCR